ncbi:MAG: response regulator transcription factor [Erysipelothrix sp.]|nr:response regulator transcription factor [Erysipelothrix sp.]
MYKIMIVEDNVNIRQELSSFLTNNGYEVKALASFDNAIKDILEADIDLILLDLTLPNIDGHYIAREIRKTSDIPIIVVTSRDSKMDELLSINIGADDYVTKPYDLQILLARIESLMRRVNKSEQVNSLSIGKLTVNLETASITKDNFSIDLTKNELLIITYFIKNKNRIVSRHELIQHLWGDDSYIDENTLTVNVNRLRLKLLELEVEDLIETKRGMGYIIHES